VAVHATCRRYRRAVWPQLNIAAQHLGRIDTFRFEEKSLLAHTYSLISADQFGDALKIVTERKKGFWVRHSHDRQLQWAACQRMAELGTLVREVGGQLEKMGTDPAAWVTNYTNDDSWHRADSAHRNLEALLARIDEQPGSEAALHRVRQSYEELLQRMAVAFTKAFKSAGWSQPVGVSRLESAG
jgi:hypothetical protein